MATILVHVTTGLENPTKAARVFLVAMAVVEEGHETAIFLASASSADLLLPRPADLVKGLCALGTGIFVTSP